MKLVVFFVLLFLSLSASAQITFSDPDTPWEQLAKKARKEKKLIFIHLENSKCEQCNEVATQGFSGSLLKEKFEQNFIAIRSNVETENGKKLAEKFQIKGSLLSLFVDAEGNILNRYNGSTSSPMIYAEQADIALGRRGRKQLNDYDKEYRSGERSPQFLKEYIVKRREAHLPANDLLDEYVKDLPADSMNNFNTVKFIYQNGPAIDSETYIKIQSTTRPSLIDSIYRSVPFNEAVGFNNGIIGSSFRNAVTKKDAGLAVRVAHFARSTYTNDPARGRMTYHGTMLNYYHAVKDTSNFLAAAAIFIEKYYLPVTLDSLKRMDQRVLDQMKASKPVIKEGTSTQTFKVSPPSQYYHIELNNRAWQFWEWATTKSDLEKALSWSKRSIEWFDELMEFKTNSPSKGNPGYLDTYAHLLYKLDRRSEAVEWQTKAVEAQKAAGMTSASFENTLNKMKSGTL